MSAIFARRDRNGREIWTYTAISKAELALSATPEDHPDRARRLDNLVITLSDRYKRAGNIDDLRAAHLNAELALYTTPTEQDG